MPSRLLESAFIPTPQLFTENGAPPALASPEGLYEGFHLERYIHTLPALDAPPAEDALVIIALEPTHFSLRQGKRFQQGVTQRGEIVMYPQGHSGRWEWQSPVDCLHLRLEPWWLERMAAQNGLRPGDLVERFNVADVQILHIGLALLGEAEAGSPNGRLFGESLMTALTAHLFAHYAAFPVRANPAKEASRRLSPAELNRVTEYLQENLTRDVSLEALANVVSVSPYHFTRLFKRSVGMTPHQYVIKERVERAKTLLRQGDMTVASIAAAAGFADAAHLSRLMKRLVGTTPQQFRSGN